MTVTIRVLSDLHAEFMDDPELFARCLPREGVDVLVLAGDIGVAHRGSLLVMLRALCERFRDSAVLFVPGNHEWYWPERAESERFKGMYDAEMVAYRRPSYKLAKVLERARAACPNLLACSPEPFQLTHKGVHFVGATMWFRPEPGQPVARLNDFRMIPAFRPSVELWHREHVAFLREHMKPGSVVVTHHLPHPASIHPEYRGGDRNCFYLAPEGEGIIRENRPAAWIHGHTHHTIRENVPVDAPHGFCRIVCNPYGYEGHELNRSWNPAFDLVL